MLLRISPGQLFAYWERSLLVTDNQGMIGEGSQGLYEHDLRILSRYRFLVNGQVPRLDQLSTVDPYSTLGYYCCPAYPGQSGDEADLQVVIRVGRFVGQGLHEDLEVTNYGQTEASLALAWELAVDFADLLEALNGTRRQEAPITVSWQKTQGAGGDKHKLRFEYHHPQLPRATSIRLVGVVAPPTWDGTQLHHLLTLGPRESAKLCLMVAPVVDGQVREPVYSCDAFGAPAIPADRSRTAWAARATRISTSNATVQQAWDRAIADLAALSLGTALDARLGAHVSAAELATPTAGIPRFGALFGRDALTASGQSLLFSPIPAEGSLRLLARFLGATNNDFYDEQPGRVAQQIRDDPLALLGIEPYTHYYGDYAAPCAFLVLVAAHHLVVGDHELTRAFLEPARRVLDWLDAYGDMDGDGFLEYVTRSPRGQKNQGWKDSGNAIIYDDGRQVDDPIATCELQGYWYAAKLLMAEVFLNMGDPGQAYALYREAESLKRRFQARFWMEDERFIALALDPAKRQVKSIASNAGHCLATGIVDHTYVSDIAHRLLAPDMFSGWGIRTLSADHPSYNPFSYQLGSVWPSENATLAFGMKRYGLAAEANTVVRGIFDAAALFEHTRLPETFGGHPRDVRHPHPGIYPNACAPQAWSASAVAWLVQTMLGLWSYAPLRVLVVDPTLPEWLPELTLSNLQIRDARVSIQFKRDASGATDYRVLEREGTLHVVRQPPPSAHAGPITRLRDLVESLLPGH